MPTMDIPGVGNVEKKYVYIGGGAVVVIAGYMYWRNKQSSTAATDAAVSDTVTDPNADAAGLGADTYDPSGTYGYGYDYSSGATGYQSPVNQTIPVTSEQQITTDAAWDSAAVAQAGDIGVDPTALSSALGRFLAGLCVDAAQADLVRQAEGLLGRPPQSATLEIHICPPSGSGGSTSPGAGLAAPGGLHVTSSTTTHVSLAWTAVPGATGYRLYRSDVSTNVGSTSGPAGTVGGLSHNKTYKFHVRAIGSDGKYGAASATVSGKTKK